jgi:DNA-binding FadR family transcriptional regulator
MPKRSKGHIDLHENRTMTEKRLYHSVADQILKLISDGAFPPGSRLPGERELAERFSVSRVTVREAEIALQALGYIRIKTGSGVYVLDPATKESQDLPSITAFELTEARLIFESEAAALAARHIDDETLDHLSELVETMAKDQPDFSDASAEADQEFHLAIAAASGNKAVQYIIETLWKIRNQVPAIREVHESICAHDDQLTREHADVVNALRQRDPAAAREAMRAHFRGLLGSMIDVTEEKALQELRKQLTESRQRYLDDVAHGGATG